MADEPERVEVQRTGGFANIPMRATIPAHALAPEERAAVDALLRRAPAEQPAPGRPDRYQYDITVVAGDRRHHVRLGEWEIDDELRALIDRAERDAAP
jgi:CHASE2 domain-containing sensor protein